MATDLSVSRYIGCVCVCVCDADGRLAAAAAAIIDRLTCMLARVGHDLASLLAGYSTPPHTPDVP